MDQSATPIKRSKALVEYSREHHFGLLLIWKIREGLKKNIELKRITNYLIWFFNQEIELHFKDEEVSLFEKLPLDDTLRKQAFDEHNQIYQLIVNLQKDSENVLLLKEFADSLESHIRFEERILFNHIEKYLTDKELKHLEMSHRKSEKNIDEKWEDWFWDIKKNKN